MLRYILILLFVVSQTAVAQSRLDRYALILEDPPLVEQWAKAGVDIRRAAASGEGVNRIRAAQMRLEEVLESNGIAVTGSTQRLLNAVYVRASAEKLRAMGALPGVQRILASRPAKLQMNRAAGLVDVPGAWAQLGGSEEAGAGVRVGILDTGIDHKHAAFQDPSLVPPSGYPRCAGVDCDYTSNKIIVARSYVDLLVWGDVPEISRPDDETPRDRVGHGTATAMVVAGVPTAGPAANVAGVAPKAFLGNYKIFGSPGVNDGTFADVATVALEDALVDGMDLVLLAIGLPAEWLAPDDWWAEVIENAIAAGMTIIAPAGNDGDLEVFGSRFPTITAINTPGIAPSAITVGASTSSHEFFSSVKVRGEGAPAELQWMRALFGDGPRPAAPLTAPMRDVGVAEPIQTACQPIGAGTLSGAIALVDRGDCSFVSKINNAHKAGAVAVIIIRTDSELIFPMTGLIDTAIPAVMVGSTDGQKLRNFVRSTPDFPGTLDPNLDELDARADEVAFFSSRGPSINNGEIKPDLVAPGTDVYMATQTYDPNGDMWDPAGYTAAQGTSFAAAITAGGVALVKQANPGFGPAQLKSAVVNTATGNVMDLDGSVAGVTVVGAGKLNVSAAVRTNVTAEPATISFGFLNGALPARGVTIRNTGTQPVNLALTVVPADPRLTLNKQALALAPGAAETISVTLNQMPDPGSYEGFVVITGGATALRVPYLYIRGDGVPFDLIPLAGVDFLANVDEEVCPDDDVTECWDFTVKVIDRYGVPVPDVTVVFRPTVGGGQIKLGTDVSDFLGIVAAEVILGPNPGEHEFTARIQGRQDMVALFAGRAKRRGVINFNGAVNAASGEIGLGLAPGSYISIFGGSLSETLRVFSTLYLPVSLAGVSVSFDVPERKLSVPGKIHFVSEGQVNVVIPWELAGLNTALMKISTGPITESALYPLPLNPHSPGFFEIRDPGGTERMVIAALDENSQVISSANPVQRGHVAQLFMNGLGPVDNPPASGEITPASPLARTLTLPTVTVGGTVAVVDFSGLTPGSIALYQVNVFIPEGLAPGLYEVVLTIGGVQAKTALIYVGA